MSKLRQFALRKENALMRLAVMLMVPAILLASTVSFTAYAQNLYVIYDGDSRQVIHSDATDATEVLAEAGIELARADKVNLNSEGMASEIIVERNQIVYINNGGDSMALSSYGETVGDLLENHGLTLNEGDAIDTDLSTKTYHGMELNIDRLVTVTETYTEAVPFATEYVEKKTMLKGDEKVITEGVEGQLLCTANVTYFNGEEISREVLTQTETQAPVNQVVAQGTLEAEKGKLTIEDGVIVTPDGKVYTYDRTMKVKATAYTHTDKGCDKITATGTTVRWGTVAVDPKLIPYGTKMFIVSNDGKFVYGLSAAEDCGGSIKGKRIDLYMPTTKECFAFGVRNCTVYFIG